VIVSSGDGTKGIAVSRHRHQTVKISLQIRVRRFDSDPRLHSQNSTCRTSN